MPFLYASLPRLLLLCMGALSICGHVLSNPAGRGPDPIDHCLMACMSCYGTQNNNFMQQYLVRYFGFSVLSPDDPASNSVEQHELKQDMERILLHCANIVCLKELPRGSALPVFWRLTCPSLTPLFHGDASSQAWGLLN